MDASHNITLSSEQERAQASSRVGIQLIHSILVPFAVLVGVSVILPAIMDRDACTGPCTMVFCLFTFEVQSFSFRRFCDVESPRRGGSPNRDSPRPFRVRARERGRGRGPAARRATCDAARRHGIRIRGGRVL